MQEQRVAPGVDTFRCLVEMCCRRGPPGGGGGNPMKTII